MWVHAMILHVSLATYAVKYNHSRRSLLSKGPLWLLVIDPSCHIMYKLTVYIAIQARN